MLFYYRLNSSRKKKLAYCATHVNILFYIIFCPCSTSRTRLQVFVASHPGPKKLKNYIFHNFETRLNLFLRECEYSIFVIACNNSVFLMYHLYLFEHFIQTNTNTLLKTLLSFLFVVVNFIGFPDKFVEAFFFCIMPPMYSVLSF